MAMNVATVRAAAAHGRRATKRRFFCAVGIGPRRIAAEGAHWRPVGHRRRGSAFIISGKVAGSVDDLSADDGQFGRRFSDLVFRTGEVVTVRNDQIRKLARLDASPGLFNALY